MNIISVRSLTKKSFITYVGGVAFNNDYYCDTGMTSAFLSEKFSHSTHVVLAGNYEQYETVESVFFGLISKKVKRYKLGKIQAYQVFLNNGHDFYTEVDVARIIEGES